MRAHPAFVVLVPLVLLLASAPPARAAGASACGLVLAAGAVEANCIAVSTSHAGGSCVWDPDAGAPWCSASTFTATVTLYGWVNSGAVQAEMEEVLASPLYAPPYQFCTKDSDAAAWAGIPFDGGNAALTLSVSCDAGYCLTWPAPPPCVDVRLDVQTFGAGNPGSFSLHETY